MMGIISRVSATQILSLIIWVSALIAGRSNISHAQPYEYTKDLSHGRVIRVGGKVLCQDCKANNWIDWLDEAKPVVGAVVSITCMDSRGRAVYYSRNVTDNSGVFELCLERYRYERYGLDGCRARLLYSPDKTCDVVTNFGGGRSGATLERPSIVYRELTKYIVGPFSFTPDDCATLPSYHSPPPLHSDEPGTRY